MKKERLDISPNALEILSIQFQNRRSNLHFQEEKFFAIIQVQVLVGREIFKKIFGEDGKMSVTTCNFLALLL